MLWKEDARIHALINAVEYGGDADLGAVMGKIMSEHEELRNRAPEIKEDIAKIVDEINSLSLEDQESQLKELAPEALSNEEEDRKYLPELPGDTSEVRMRFAPNPSGPLHLGHARAVILNDEYVKRYDGSLILRIEDTDPRRVYPRAYDMILDDMKFLDSIPDETIIQSKRMDEYYRIAQTLLDMGAAYICNCSDGKFRQLKIESKACPCRTKSTDDNLDKWKMMVNGYYSAGEAVMRIKTSLNHPDPAIREWPAFRIVEEPHPVFGDQYNAYPLMNFSVAVDDYLLDISHVIRGKDHIPSEKRQRYIFDYMDWDIPQYVHHGTLSIKEVELSTRKIKEGIDSGRYEGWDDMRLGTIRTLKRRGITSEAIRQAIIKLGLSEVDASFSWKNLYSENRKVIDESAERYFFVPDPLELNIEKAPSVTATPQIHPDIAEKRHIEVKENPCVLISSEDANELDNGDVIRLKNLYNIEIIDIDNLTAEYHSDDLSLLEEGIDIIQWVLSGDFVDVRVLKPESTIEGKAEKLVGELEIGKIVQFERFGFTRIDSKHPVVACYAHR